MTRSDNQGVLDLTWSLRISTRMVMLAGPENATIGICSIETVGSLVRWPGVLRSHGFRLRGDGKVREINCLN